MKIAIFGILRVKVLELTVLKAFGCIIDFEHDCISNVPTKLLHSLVRKRNKIRKKVQATEKNVVI